ncbi:MAG TPA: hypothetical protein VF768_06295, partial [Holophagaceae bacterium]
MSPPRLDAPRRWHLWPRAFRQRLLAGMALALGTTMLLFTARVTFTQRRELLRQSEERGMVLAKALAVIDLPEILESDIQGLDEMIHSVSGYPDLRYAMVLTPEGRVLAHTDPAQVGRYLSDPISRQWLRGPAAPTTLTRSESLVDVAAPVLVQGRLVGWVRVGLGQQALAASLRDTLRDGAVLTALALVLGAGAALLASRHLARGIDRLVRLARETDPNRIVFLSRRDELSELGRAFDR